MNREYQSTQRVLRAMHRVMFRGLFMVAGGLLVAGFPECGSGLSNRAPVTFADGQAAAVVIGQPDMVTADPLLDADGMSGPIGAPLVVGGRLYVPDSANWRVLGFNGIPATDGRVADFVLGQADLITRVAGTSATRMVSPEAVHTHGGKLYVTDAGNSRILIWNTLPTANEAPADLAVGQMNLDSAATACTRDGLNTPGGSFAAGGRLFVADTNNHRVLIYPVPTVTGPLAAVVLGQQSFIHCAANDLDDDGISDTPDATTLNNPTSVWSDGTKLVVADSSNNRLLIWNSIPTSHAAPADVVVGQADFVSNAPGTSATTLDTPQFVHGEGGRLFIADWGNNRVLLFDAVPTTDGEAASGVIGQADFSSNAPATTATGLNGPTGVMLSGTRLFVTDQGNNRVLIYESQ